MKRLAKTLGAGTVKNPLEKVARWDSTASLPTRLAAPVVFSTASRHNPGGYEGVKIETKASIRLSPDVGEEMTS